MRSCSANLRSACCWFANPNVLKRYAVIFEKWDLSAAIIGTVTDSGRVKIKSPQGEWVVDMPVGPLADQAPVYDRPYEEPESQARYRGFDQSPYLSHGDHQTDEVFRALLAAPNIASKRWFFRQYDHTVQTNTMRGPGAAEAALVRIKDTNKALAITCDCNPRFVQLDPALGTAHAVAEGARNISCTGALPLALTDCMNFGNPEVPGVMWQFKTSVDGMAEACTALEVPVISGNVSLYNETNGKPIFPTPALGMVGLLEDREHYAVNHFTKAGQPIYLLGVNREELGGSEYLAHIHNLTDGVPPQLDLAFEKTLQAALREAVNKGRVSTARDCSLGGLAIALAKCGLGEVGRMGFNVDLTGDIHPTALLFGESASRVVTAVDADQAAAFEKHMADAGVPCTRLGETGGDRLTISVKGDVVIDEAAEAMHDHWENALEHILN